MDEQRERARAGSAGRRRATALRERAQALAGEAGFATDFVGYETTEQRDDGRRGRRSDNGRVLVKLRRVAVLRRPAAARSPTRARSSAPTATAARASRMCCGSATTRSLALVPERGALEGRRARARARRPRRPPCDRVQPHRHPPAARGAARAPRHARPPGRLLRRARQAALRLHARQRR